MNARTRKRHGTWLCLLAAMHAGAIAQTPQVPPPPQTQPQPPPATPQQPALPPGQSVEVTGQRNDETQERRQSTAAKIVVGRGEIERYGDATLGDLLRRLPGVTVTGSPRRGGQLRMRGLGQGYTQVLLDGERVPATFSIESLAPEQIERIEILRAPTAETGTRAIAGTINIITREGSNKRGDDLRLGTVYESGHAQPVFSWTHTDRVVMSSGSDLLYNWSLQIQDELTPRDIDSVSTVEDEDVATGATTFAQREKTHTHDKRQRVNLSTRLQWRNDRGDGLTITPLVTHTRDDAQRDITLTQSAGASPALYDHAFTDAKGERTQMRLGTRWRSTIGEDGQLELRATVRDSKSTNRGVREEYDTNDTRVRIVTDDATTRERSVGGGIKFTEDWGDDHVMTLGGEAENGRRSDARTTLQNGLPLLTDFGDELGARSKRIALYAQDEWTLTPQWVLQAGLRAESIATRGDAGTTNVATNRSRVIAPLLHLLWKPSSSDRLRLGLTRSYRSPNLSSLLGRPSLSSRYPVSGPNQPTSPDRVGNPNLKPELADGIDLGYEHYLAGGGLVGANIFHRRIRDVLRTLTSLETVPWSTSQRWVSRPGNVGRATTTGLELEAKGRLDELWPDAPRIGFQANAAYFLSRVQGVPGPNNRLDEQPKSTLNLGLDYRLRGLPLAFGTSWNRVPAYNTQLSDTQSSFNGRKSVVDAYALWTINDKARVRLSTSNAVPIDSESGSTIDAVTFRETSKSVTTTDRSWMVRLEMKL